MEVVAEEVHPWCLALANIGVTEPEPGYELLDGKGRVVAEAEVAWPSIRVAVFLPDTLEAATVFTSQSWHCFTAAGGELPQELKNLLMETLA
jgi:DEAD/DEAH box helicase domain-containing protein